jgi:2,4-dienoyl-CoA reductase-like NADH-dependent reductase (Old Yellow Enzyme family)
MSILFEPSSIGQMALKNRIVKSAFIENMATPDGQPTEDTLRYYERLARGGVGLIITGMAYVNRMGKGQPLQHGAHTDEMVPAWRKITDSVHQLGGKIAMQIVHCGRQCNPKALNGAKAVDPSASPNLYYLSRSRAMTGDEIVQTIDDFGYAAARVKEAGFDAVQVHGAHGYLVSSFLSPLTNRRRDEWGGDAARRFRFPAEVYNAVRRAVGPNFPVLFKMNAKDFTWSGLTPDESFPAARRLAEFGLDALEISGGIFETFLHSCRGSMPSDLIALDRSPTVRRYLLTVFGLQKMFIPFKEAYFLPYAAKLKPTLKIPLILVGGIRTPETAERILETGAADFISMARPLVREPDLPNKWLSGRRVAAQCSSCNRCAGEEDRGNKARCYARKRDCIDYQMINRRGDC